MTRPNATAVLLLAAANACGAVADSLASLSSAGIGGDNARRSLKTDRETAVRALDALPDEYDIREWINDIGAGNDTEAWAWAEQLREWAKAHPSDAPGIIDLDASEEPWILVDPGSLRPYWAGLRESWWTAVLGAAKRFQTEADAAGVLGGPSPCVAIPLSRAEATAYPNGRPTPPVGVAPAATTPASPPTVAGAAQAPTVGERVALEWELAYDASDWNRGSAKTQIVARIDAAIAQAVAEVESARDHNAAESLVRLATSIREALSAEKSRCDVGDLTESRAKLIRGRDAYASSYDRANRAEQEMAYYKDLLAQIHKTSAKAQA